MIPCVYVSYMCKLIDIDIDRWPCETSKKKSLIIYIITGIQLIIYASLVLYHFRIIQVSQNLKRWIKLHQL